MEKPPTIGKNHDSLLIQRRLKFAQGRICKKTTTWLGPVLKNVPFHHFEPRLRNTPKHSLTNKKEHPIFEIKIWAEIDPLSPFCDNATQYQ